MIAKTIGTIQGRSKTAAAYGLRQGERALLTTSKKVEATARYLGNLCGRIEAALEDQLAGKSGAKAAPAAKKATN